MAEEDATTPKPDRSQARAAARGAQSNPSREVAPGEVKYSVADLMENPRLIRSNTRAIAGAFHDEPEGKRVTLEEAAKRVGDFLERPEDES